MSAPAEPLSAELRVAFAYRRARARAAAVDAIGARLVVGLEEHGLLVIERDHLARLEAIRPHGERAAVASIREYRTWCDGGLDRPLFPLQGPPNGAGELLAVYVVGAGMVALLAAAGLAPVLALRLGHLESLTWAARRQLRRADAEVGAERVPLLPSVAAWRAVCRDAHAPPHCPQGGAAPCPE